MSKVKANVFRTMYAVASAFQTRSVRILAFWMQHVSPDAECQGKCLPDDTCHGIYLPDEECQGICLQEAACVLQMQSVKVDIVWTSGKKIIAS